MQKSKFITALALAAALLFSACDKTETDNTDVNVEVPDYTYDESTNTYTVYTADGLLAWNEAAQIDTTLNCTLAADIDMTSIEWTPVGNDTIRYNGTFEGGDHTITGLTINQSEAYYVGLIGYLDTLGKVQNLTLDNVSITGYQCVGGVVGTNYGTVTACSVSGSVSGTYQHIGGVVGWSSGTVIACYASSSVNSEDSNVGGVAGRNSGTVIACYALGDVSGDSNVGGVIGRLSGTVTACYHASGSISNTGTNVGSVVGRNYYGTVTTCYWSDYDGDGIGQANGGYGTPTKVDGTDVTWETAVTNMKSAIDTWNDENDGLCEWTYELITGNDYPTLTKN